MTKRPKEKQPPLVRTWNPKSWLDLTVEERQHRMWMSHLPFGEDDDDELENAQICYWIDAIMAADHGHPDNLKQLLPHPMPLSIVPYMADLLERKCRPKKGRGRSPDPLYATLTIEVQLKEIAWLVAKRGMTEEAATWQVAAKFHPDTRVQQYHKLRRYKESGAAKARAKKLKGL